MSTRRFSSNVGSNQLQSIRKGLRGDSVVLMGKNTVIKRSIRVHAEKSGNNAILKLVHLLAGNVGLIFTMGDLKEVSEEVARYKIKSLYICQVGAPARVRVVAPIDVIAPPWQYWSRSITDLFLPARFSIFQRGLIKEHTAENITPLEIIKRGEKVGSSEAALLSKLGIRPFTYGLTVLSVSDNGSVFSPEVLDLTEDDLIEKFAMGVSMVASLSVAISYPTLAAAPHIFFGNCSGN